MNIRPKRNNEQAWVGNRNAPNFGLPNAIDLGSCIQITVNKTCAVIHIVHDGPTNPKRVELHDGNYLVWDGYRYCELTPEAFDEKYEDAFK